VPLWLRGTAHWQSGGRARGQATLSFAGQPVRGPGAATPVGIQPRELPQLPWRQLFPISRQPTAPPRQDQIRTLSLASRLCPNNTVRRLMRTQKGTLVKISVVALLLTAGVLWLFRDSLRVQYHLRAERHAGQQMFAPKPSTLGQQVVAFLLHRPSWEAWSKVREDHEDALVRLGYLSRQEFSFTNRTLNAMQLMTNARSGFSTLMTTICVLTNGQPLSATSVCTSSVVRVTAPKNEGKKWRTLISELDQNTR
jgi:hypothetical protein